MLEPLLNRFENFQISHELTRLLFSTLFLITSMLVLCAVASHLNQRGLEAPTVDPRVTLQFPDTEEVYLIVRVPAKAAQKSFIE